MSTSLTIAVVNWNTREELRRCLTALETATAGLHAGIVVVDNASPDGSAAMVAEEFPGVILIANAHNEGFGAGVNAALRAAPADFYLVLNPDVEVASGVIEQMAGFLESRREAAAVSPLLLGEDRQPHAHFYRRFPSLSQMVLFWTLLGVYSQRIPRLRRKLFEHDLRGSGPTAVDQLPGAALLIRDDALSEIGLFDPDFFIWWEDVDWCYRARKAGYELYVLPELHMQHVGGASFRAWGVDTRIDQFYRAFVRFACKHRDERLLRLGLPLLYADLLMKEVILRLYRALGIKRFQGSRSLRRTRRAMREIVRRYRGGEVVRLTGLGEMASDSAPDAPSPTK